MSLLPTPAVNDMGAGKSIADWDSWTSEMQARHGNGNGHGASLSVEALRMLPTPDATHSRRQTRTGPLLAGALLPTPITDPGTGNGHARYLGAEVGHSRWGAYAAAVGLWETVTRPAPDPTEPTGRGGRHRLSPAFVEWMMGLPPGHVTALYADRTLSYGQALRLLGNGVVPAQASVAVSHLLEARETWGAAA